MEVEARISVAGVRGSRRLRFCSGKQIAEAWGPAGAVRSKSGRLLAADGALQNNQPAGALIALRGDFVSAPNRTCEAAAASRRLRLLWQASEVRRETSGQAKWRVGSRHCEHTAVVLARFSADPTDAQVKRTTSRPSVWN